MTKEEFKDNFLKALDGLIPFTQEFVINDLPSEVKFIIKPNSSYDGNPLVDDEEIFPNDNVNIDSQMSPCDFDNAIDYLWRNGKVPEWINVSVYRCDTNYTYVKLESCGRYSGNINNLYHVQEGRPPFHALSPSIPLNYFDQETEDLKEKVDLNKL